MSSSFVIHARRVANGVLDWIVRMCQQFEVDDPSRRRRPAGVPILHGIKLSQIYHCGNCDEVILYGVPRGFCPACGSSQVYPLMYMLRPAWHRAWIQRIGVGGNSNGRALRVLAGDQKKS